MTLNPFTLLPSALVDRKREKQASEASLENSTNGERSQMSEKKTSEKELPIIQQTYDLIKWYVPVLNNLPRDHHFILGDRIIRLLYETLEQLFVARYSREKLPCSGQRIR